MSPILISTGSLPIRSSLTYVPLDDPKSFSITLPLDASINIAAWLLLRTRESKNPLVMSGLTFDPAGLPSFLVSGKNGTSNCFLMNVSFNGVRVTKYSTWFLLFGFSLLRLSVVGVDITWDCEFDLLRLTTSLFADTSFRLDGFFVIDFLTSK